MFTLITRFTYNGDGARLAVEVVGHGTTTYTLDYAAGSRVLVEHTLTDTTLYLYGHDCLGEFRDDEWLYYLNDSSGYVRQGTNEDGQVVSGWLFDPDGTLLEGPEGPVSHLVCGGVYDWSTGLIYKDGRYFDPLLGIWLALAPLIMIQSWRGRKKKRRGFPWYLVLALCLVGVSGTLVGCEGDDETPTPTCTTIAPAATLPTLRFTASPPSSVTGLTQNNTMVELGDISFAAEADVKSSDLQKSYSSDFQDTSALMFMQLYKGSRMITLDDGRQYQESTGQDWYLDNYPLASKSIIPYQGDVVPVKKPGTYELKADDNPGLSLNPSDLKLPGDVSGHSITQVSIVEEFEMYVLWRYERGLVDPDSVTAVPLGKIHWEWRFEAQKNTQGVWSSSPSNPPYVTPGPIQPTPSPNLSIDLQTALLRPVTELSFQRRP